MELVIDRRRIVDRVTQRLDLRRHPCGEFTQGVQGFQGFGAVARTVEVLDAGDAAADFDLLDGGVGRCVAGAELEDSLELLEGRVELFGRQLFVAAGEECGDVLVHEGEDAGIIGCELSQLCEGGQGFVGLARSVVLLHLGYADADLRLAVQIGGIFIVGADFAHGLELLGGGGELDRLGGWLSRR